MIFILILGLFNSVVFSISNTGSISENKVKLNDTNKKINNKKNQMKVIKNQVISIEDEVNQLDSLIEETEKEITKTEELIQKKEVEIEDFKTSISSLEKEVGSLSEARDKRIVSIYTSGGFKKNNMISFFNALFGGKGFNSILNNTNNLLDVVEYDTKLIDKADRKKNLLQDKKNLLMFEQKNLDDLKKAFELKEKYIEEQKGNKIVYLESLVDEKEELEKILKDLEDASKQIDELIKKLQSQKNKAHVPLKPGKGIFGLPVKDGRITSPFGWRNHPISKKRSFHTGVDIAKKYNAPIYASQSGKVIYSGNAGAYGRVLIIDHGNGWTSMYAHNNKLLVKKGDTVSIGQVISKMGSTGYSTGPHLHFEIRYKGKPNNPMNFL